MQRRMAQAMVLLSCGTLFADYIEDRAAAAKLMRSRKYDEALATLRKMTPHDRVGYWHGVGLCALAGTLADVGRHKEALAAYREVLADEKAHPNHRKAAQEAIDRAATK